VASTQHKSEKALTQWSWQQTFDWSDWKWETGKYTDGQKCMGETGKCGTRLHGWKV